MGTHLLIVFLTFKMFSSFIWFLAIAKGGLNLFF